MDSPLDICDLPNEILLTALAYLNKTDLASVRETCKKLSPIASKVYFKTCTTSFLHLDQLLLLANHPEFSQYVEHMRFQEISFKVQAAPGAGPSDPDTPREFWGGLGKILSIILNHHSMPFDSRFDPYLRVDYNKLGYPTIAPPKFKPELAIDLLNDLISAARAEFNIQHSFQDLLSAYRLIKAAITGLPSLRRVSFVNGRYPGIHVNTRFMPKHLKMLNDYFPISEALFQMEFNENPNAPYQGFLQVLAAFHDLNRDLDEINVQHDGSFLTSGMEMMAVEEFPQHLRALVLPAFRRIRHLQLKIGPMENGRGASDNQMVEKPFLMHALAEATQLHSLALAFESRPARLGMYEDVLPTSEKFPSLHTLRLHNITFDTPTKLIRFLMFGLPALRNLSLSLCRAGGRWQDVFQHLSDAPKFSLDMLHTSELYDSTNPGDIQSWVGGVLPKDLMVPSIIPAAHLLYFVNHPGSPNPFVTRRWRQFDHDEYDAAVQSGEQMEVDMEEFEDMSDWQPGSDYGEIVKFQNEDPDGPEFDSEYDFDAESDSSGEDGEEVE